MRADDEQQIHIPDDVAHGLLAVLGGVADVADIGPDDRRKLQLQRLDDVAGIVDAQGGLGHVGEFPGVGDLQGIDVLDGGDQMHAARNAPLGPFDLRVAFVPDENHVPPAHGVVLSFLVDLGHQGTGGVDHRQVPVQGFVFDRRRRAVGAQNGDGAVRNIGDLFDEDGPLFAKRIDDPLVVHDLVADIDRRTEPLEGPFDDFDGALHARAEAARLGQVDGET